MRIGMTALCYSDRQLELVRKISKGCTLVSPTEDGWIEVSPEEYERQARNLACGLMVRGLKRGGSLTVSHAGESELAFISFGCRLAHLSVCTGDADSADLDASGKDILYLVRIGYTWMNKYGLLIDRSFRELEMSLTGDNI